MGREIKRVPLDFNWPINKIWHGYRIVTCLSEEPGCDDCRLFGKLKGMDFTSYDCPVFTEIEPPSGEGFQLWETTSEGSPISPVFDTPEKLAQWLADNKASSFGRQTASYEEWLNFITGPGRAPSAVSNGCELISGVEAVSRFK